MQANLARSQRQKHATKRGPGRQHKDGTFRGGKAKKTNFAAALMAHWAAKRAGSKAHKAKHTLRDDHGAFTYTGAERPVFENPFPARMERRKWLAGISAQRGA